MSKNRLGVVAAFALLFSGIAWAQGSGTLTIPVRVVDGHIMVIGYLSNRAGDINDVSLEVSFQDKGVFTLDGNQYGWLDNPAVIKLLLKPDVQLEFAAAEVKAESRAERSAMHDQMTKMFSNKLDEHKVKGILGAGFLRKYHVALDLAGGTLTLSPPGAPAQGETVSAFTLQDGRISIPMAYADGKTGELVLGGDAYDTYIDSAIAQGLGKPAGDVSPAWLGAANSGIDLSSRVALRPGAVKGATVVAGVNLFEGLRVEVDWNGSRVAFTPTKPPQYPKADLAYFKAEVADTPAAYQSYLEQYPSARLSPEAATRLMAGLLKQKDSTDEQFMQGLKWVAETSPAERKMENCTVAVRAFRAMPGRDALVAQSGNYALQFSREAVTVQDTYRLHNIIGEAYLNQDKLEEAWKHFLSAAFMPLDNKTDLVHNIEVNYNLARTYDRMGRATRAYSRYVRTEEMIAPIADQVEGAPSDDPEMPAETRRQITLLKAAIAETKSALERLRKQIPADELEMLEG